MSGLFSGYSGTARSLAIILSTAAIDETAAQGTLVGTLTSPASTWRFQLADDANEISKLD